MPNIIEPGWSDSLGGYVTDVEYSMSMGGVLNVNYSVSVPNGTDYLYTAPTGIHVGPNSKPNIAKSKTNMDWLRAQVDEICELAHAT